MLMLLLLLQDVKIDVCAILNDTTGTLMSCAWKNKNCRIGLIVGKQIQFLKTLLINNKSKLFSILIIAELFLTVYYVLIIPQIIKFMAVFNCSK